MRIRDPKDTGEGGAEPAADAVEAAEFETLMTPLGPFEARPDLAVAVSGGADSMALVRLASAWADRRGGRAVGLTVDHGLRPESAAEARQVGRWLAAAGIDHHVLRWRRARDGRAAPRIGLQAAARDARYRLLGEWCRRRGVFHLLLAHHLDDQAETVLLRLARGSGVDGLAAMSGVTTGRPAVAGVRLLRPLLEVPKARLVATLHRLGQPWIEDPSNRDPAYARTRARAALVRSAAGDVTARRLAATARAMGRARVALGDATTALLVEAAELDPAGHCRLRPRPLVEAPEEIGLRALARVLVCVGGADYAPRLERLERLYRAIAASSLGRGRTLLGCRVVPYRDSLLVVREARAADQVLALDPGRRGRWDGRFEVRLGRDAAKIARGPTTVRRLGRAGFAAVVGLCPAVRASPVPPAARPALPAVWDDEGPLAVPHLAFVRPGPAARPGALFTAVFAPNQTLSPPTFVPLGVV